MGLIDYQERTVLEHILLNGTYQQRIRDMRGLHDTFDLALDYIVNQAGGVNVYDITSYQDYPTLLLESFFGNPVYQKMLKLNPNVTYSAQSDKVYEHLYEDFMQQYVHLVEDLLEKNVNVMIYNGQNDLIVETPGTFKWAEFLHYKDAETFRNTLMTPWRVGGKVAGFRKIVGKLELRTVNDAGHLVPMDQGAAALDMVRHFVHKSMQ